MPISDITETLPLVDHHCHGLFPVDLDDERLADSLSEAFAPAPPGTTHWDKPVALSLSALVRAPPGPGAVLCARRLRRAPA